MMKKYTYAGISLMYYKNTDTVKWRFRVANSRNRVKHLERWGDTKIDLLDLPRAMTRAEAALYLLNCELFHNNEQHILECLKPYADKHTQE